MALVEAEAEAEMVGREGRNGREDGNNNDKVKASDNSMHNDKFKFKARDNNIHNDRLFSTAKYYSNRFCLTLPPLEPVLMSIKSWRYLASLALRIPK